MRRVHVLGLLVFTYASPSFAQTGTVTRAFRDGVSPDSSYAGTRDTRINSDTPTTNFGANIAVQVDGDPDRSGLVRWDLSGIPAGSVIQSATITVFVTNQTSQTYEAYELLKPWVEGQATWNLVSTGTPWQTAGAQGATDRGSVVLGTIGPVGFGTQTMTLNAAGVALVQKWLNTPAANFGIIVQDYPNATDGLDYSSREAGTLSQRPMLTVTYTTGVVLPMVSIVATDSAASETAPNPGTFTVTRTGSTTAALTVAFTVGGTATASLDYGALGTSVTIPVGAAAASLNVMAVDDSLVETTETVIVTLASGTGYQLGSPASATVTIADNDTVTSTVTRVFQDFVSPTANYSGTRDTYLNADLPSTSFGSSPTLLVDGSPDRASLIRWDLSGIPAGSVVQSATITVYVGNVTSQAYELYELLKPWVEGQASWNMASSSPWQVPGAQGATDRGSTVLGTMGPAGAGLQTLTLGPAGVAVLQKWLDSPATNNGFIVQDYVNASDGVDFSSRESGQFFQHPSLAITYRPGTAPPTPTVTISATTPSVPESAGAIGIFTLTRTGDTSSAGTVNLARAGTATASIDYTNFPTTVSFVANQSTVSVVVAPFDDINPEPTETVVLSLLPGSGYVVGSPQSATVSITDNDTGNTTTSFQDGVSPSSGYAGTRDAVLNADLPTTNFGSSTTLEIDGSPDRASLFRWDLSSVPAGSIIQSAIITLNVTNSTTQGYELYEVFKPWLEAQATWTVVSTGIPWETPGAQGSPDRSTTVLGRLGPVGTGPQQLILSSEGVGLVQRWVSNPAANLGVVLQDYVDASDGLGVSSRETATAALRPRLTITYGGPGPRVDALVLDPIVIPDDGSAGVSVYVKSEGTGLVVFEPASGAAARDLVQVEPTVWRLQLTAAEALFGYAADDLNRNFVGTLRLLSGPATTRFPLFINIADQTIAPVEITDLAPLIRCSGNVTSIAIGSDFDNFVPPSPAEIRAAVSLVLASVGGFNPEAPDFLNVVLSSPSKSEAIAYQALSNDAFGIGLPVFDDSLLYGQVGMQGIVHYPLDTLFDPAAPRAVHELGHRWINYGHDPLLADAGHHWPASDMARGPMGLGLPGGGFADFPFTLVQQQNGGYLIQPTTKSMFFTRLDLYLMGLIGPNEVPPFTVLTPASPSDVVAGAVVPGVVMVVQDVIDADGPRSPAANLSQHEFSFGTVVITRPRVLNNLEMAFFDHFAARGLETTVLPYAQGFEKGTTLPFGAAAAAGARVRPAAMCPGVGASDAASTP